MLAVDEMYQNLAPIVKDKHWDKCLFEQSRTCGHASFTSDSTRIWCKGRVKVTTEKSTYTISLLKPATDLANDKPAVGNEKPTDNSTKR